MSSTIKIKRSEVAGNPSILGAGELAYSGLPSNGSNGGDRLYIGMGTETNGNAVNHVVVGGKYFTDLLDHDPGVLTLSSALIVDADKKLDNLKVDNIDLNGNTVTVTDINGNLLLTGNGIGKVQISSAYALPNTDGTTGYVLTTDGAGTANWAPAASTLNLYADTGTDSIDLVTQGLTIAGGIGISTTIDTATNVLEVTADIATTSTLGIASFYTDHFTVSEGSVSFKSNVIEGIVGGMLSGTQSGINVAYNPATQDLEFVVNDLAVTLTGDVTSTTTSSGPGTASIDVTIPDASISNTQLVNNSITIGTSGISLGGTTVSLAGLQSLSVDNLTIDGNTISVTQANGNLSLSANGTGTITANSFRVTDLAEPINPNDAATKAYVDARSAGLDPKASVRVATTENITLSGTQTIDGVAAIVGNRVLVKSQTDAKTNGIYVVAAEAWSRSADFDDANEVTAGVFFFVEEGSVNGDSGFVLTTNNPVTIGTNDLTFVQFSGAGQIVAGNGLVKDGTELSVQVAIAGGIEIIGNALQLKSSLAGAGLTYSNGVLDLVGTPDRITVNANSLDIAATYPGQTSIINVGTLTAGTWNATTIGVAYGGTNITSYTAGDILVALDSNTLTKLPIGVAGSILQSNGSTLTYAILDGGSY